ncbi:alpha/beta fold hydrolase [Alkalibacillus haloalkaliphilus]|uniref:Alpha/beta hydrolase n=1 Tax=Alkalibacillus haloalkaliphilus TaxID=94136 RepID=A0A511W6S3_9BACI|nr:alpha/beta hydrolase [Alkalibacillus haloalkaliphilus]GEN46697.1 alpha/beta hydrolase [Alkalibacillus haloalkaliphilus]
MLLDYKMYQHETSKEWVVFLHGAGGNHTLFYKQAKQFKKYFNCLFINFPGHGESEPLDVKYTCKNIANKVMEVLDHLNIRKAHLVGISLGTMVMTEICRRTPERIASMTMGGAVIKWKFWTDLLFKIAYLVRSIVPYMFLYKLFAGILMPKKNHKKSRNMFVREASKLGQSEFIKWAELLVTSNNIHETFTEMKSKVPKLFLMGDEDHVFINGAHYAAERDSYAKVEVIEDCGHVCNIDQASAFNKICINFIKQHVECEETRQNDKVASTIA